MAAERASPDPVSDAQQVATTAKAALVEMRRHAVAPDPRNFALWYNYCAAHFPELSLAIDEAVSSGLSFTAERNEELYLRFLAPYPDADRLEHTSVRLQDSLQQVLGSIDRSHTATRDFGRTLDDCSDQLKAAENEGLQAMVARLILETRQMSEHTRVLETQLLESRGEVRRLRESLVSLKHETLTDTLTGVANRRAFDLKLRSAAAAARETGDPLSLLILDIDHFKKFNDTYGHQTGDQVLRLVAQILSDSVKGRDTAARYGGEEFAIILPQTPLAGAMALAENIRLSVMGRRIVRKSRGDVLGTITLSTGASLYRRGENVTAMVRRADDAMYLAKAAGRNCVRDEAALTAAAAMAATG